MGEIGSNRLAVLAAEVRTAHEGVLDAAKTAAERAIDAGRALIEAKSLLKYGQWLPWLKEHCALSDRTAQLYMQIARMGLPPETLAAMGLKAAAKAICIEDTTYNPFFHCDEEGERQWHLFVAFGIAWPHVEWLLNKQFITPDEWLGPEGARWRQAWGLRKMPAALKQAWAEFQQQHAETPLDEVVAMAEAVEKDRRDAAAEKTSKPTRRRAKRKSATVADLVGV